MRRSSREKGQGLVEYALILVLVAIVVIGILLILGPQIKSTFAQIALELEHPGKFHGSPVYVQGINVTANASCLGAVCTGVTATAAVSLVDEGGCSVSAEIYVQFTNSGGESAMASGSGSVSSGNLGGGSSGDSVQACVVGVTGHSLAGGHNGAATCGSDTYP